MDVERLLIECLDALDQGEPIEPLLRGQSAEVIAEIEAILQTAVQLPSLAHQPTLAQKEQSKQAFLAHAEQRQAQPQRSHSIAWGWLRPLLGVAVMVLIVVGLVVPAQSALPGEVLYPLKRLVEQGQYTFASSDQRLILQGQQQEARRNEIQRLLLQNQDAVRLQFEGAIVALQPDVWQVAQIPVTLDAGTVVQGTARVGEQVRVMGAVRNGRFFASTLTLLTESEMPTPAPAETLPSTETLPPSETPTVSPDEETPAPASTSLDDQTPPDTSGSAPNNDNSSSDNDNSSNEESVPPSNDSSSDSGNEEEDNNDNSSGSDDDDRRDDDDSDDNDNDSSSGNSGSGSDDDDRRDDNDSDDNDNDSSSDSDDDDRRDDDDSDDNDNDSSSDSDDDDRRDDDDDD